jgi:hypothetical protein
MIQLQSALEAVRMAGRAMAGIRPTLDLEALFAKELSTNKCPDATLVVQPTWVETSLNYGGGCSPDAYPQHTFSGIIRGRLYSVVGAFEHDFAAFDVYGPSMSGRLTGSQVSQASGVLLLSSANFASDQGLQFVGTFDLAFDFAGAAMAFSNMSVSVSKPNIAPFAITASDLRLDPDVRADFLPHSGKMTVTPISGDRIAFEVILTPDGGVVTTTR